jgi:hypothetical protein
MKATLRIIYSLATAVTTTTISVSAHAFGIVPSGTSLRVDVYGDNLPTSQSNAHLWNQMLPSNGWHFGPNEGSGNEIQSDADSSICLTPDWNVGSEPPSGTSVVARRNCANSFNWKTRDNGSSKVIYLGRYPNRCLDVPNTNKKQFQTLTVHECNRSPAQDFSLLNGNGIAPASDFQATTETTTKKPSCPARGQLVGMPKVRYEAVIAAAPINTLREVHPGHAFSAIIKSTDMVIANGNCGSYSQTDRDYKTIGAKGPYAEVPTVITSTKLNGNNQASQSNVGGYVDDMNSLRAYYDSGVPKYSSKFGFVRREISYSDYQRINNTSPRSLTNCSFYNLIPTAIPIKTISQSLCHCGDVSARIFGSATGDWSFNKDTRPWSIYDLISKKN